jgi:phenylalanyl-tRNA synthetase alpha chain
LQNNIIDIEKQALESIEQAGNSEQLEQLSIKYLGRKGVLTGFLRNISALPEDQRPSAGKRANILKGKLEKVFKNAFSKLESVDGKDFTGIDVTLPGRPALRL